MTATPSAHLDQNTITFGKYRGGTLAQVLRDRSYCRWLVEQDWFQSSYEYLYNKVKDYDPKRFFLPSNEEPCADCNNDAADNGAHFLACYPYFRLRSLEDVTAKLQLSTSDQVCYAFYLQQIDDLKQKILDRLENEEENPYDIKAPVKWLKVFETECKIPRESFREFLATYELPNIPTIIERIKQEGGIVYNGANTYKIAKQRSSDQEAWWECLLREKFGEHLGAQFKYHSCIFDFIHIPTNTIFECKLSLKDFNEDQFRKYKVTLGKYRIVYLIGRDCVIDTQNHVIRTTHPETYKEYLDVVSAMKNPSYFDELIATFRVVKTSDTRQLLADEMR